MEQPLPQCLSTNSVPRAFFPRVAIGCRLSLKIDRNLSPFWAVTLSVATRYDTAWIAGTASGENIYTDLWMCPMFKVWIWGLGNSMWPDGPCQCHSTENPIIRKLCSGYYTTKIIRWFDLLGIEDRRTAFQQELVTLTGAPERSQTIG